MRGIEFCPTCNIVSGGREFGPFQTGEWPFEVLFRPILWHLTAYEWGIGIVPALLVNFSDSEWQSKWEDDGYIPGQALFPRYATRVKNDWCEFFGVQTPSRPGREFCERCKHDWEYAKEHADVAFYCVDGARWMIFAKDESLLASLELHFRGQLEGRGIEMRCISNPHDL